MASKFFNNTLQQSSKVVGLIHQKKLLEKYYNFISCRIIENRIVCNGKLENEDWKNIYTFKMMCAYGKEPYIQIIEPFWIIPSSQIHMYSDHSLCLSYPKDMIWNYRTEVYKYSITWLVEWIYFYEKYLINGGIWEGLESPVHIDEVNINSLEDVE